MCVTVQYGLVHGVLEGHNTLEGDGLRLALGVEVGLGVGLSTSPTKVTD